MDVDITKISTKGQVVIPYTIRKKMNLVKDEQLIMMYNNNEIIIKPVKDVINSNRKKNSHAAEFIRAMRHDKILEEMEKGKEYGAEEVL
jgi:AbrB family looped-hinge helix DNA binding protein